METPPYKGYLDCVELLKSGDNPLAVLYFMSIAGRNEGLQHEWRRGPQQLEDAKRTISLNVDRYQTPYRYGKLPGRLAVFGIAFPRCTRLFWWGKVMTTETFESNLCEFYNSKPHGNLTTSEAFIGCGLENLIIAEETKLWYGAETVEEYYSLPRNPDLKIELKNPNKLA